MRAQARLVCEAIGWFQPKTYLPAGIDDLLSYGFDPSDVPTLVDLSTETRGGAESATLTAIGRQIDKRQ